MAGLRLAFWRMGAAAVIYLVLLSLAGRRLTVHHIIKSAPAGVALGLDLALFFSAIKLTIIITVHVAFAGYVFPAIGCSSIKFTIFSCIVLCV